jgi:SNF2 family DNA or RNA helicase
MMELRPYQIEGRDYLARRKRAYLADDLGLGKTVMACAAASVVNIKHADIVCPATVRTDWERMWNYWNPNAPAIVMSYEEARRHGTSGSTTLILDEAQYLAHAAAGRTKVMLQQANRASRVWFLSGTPVRNHPGELWPVLRAVWPDLLKQHDVASYAKFETKFLRTIQTQYGVKVVGTQNMDVLREILAKVMLRRRLADVALDLPPLRWETLTLDLDEASTLELNKELTRLPGYDVLVNALKVGELPRTNKHMPTIRRLIGVAKAVPAAMVLEQELETGSYNKVVVMAYHRDVLTLLHRRLNRFGLVYIDGSTSGRDRDRNKHLFQTRSDVRVFLGQITAAGVGNTLTAGHEIMLVEEMWSPEDNRQAVKRIHRFTQEHPCRARVCMLPDTIDVQVHGVNVNKLAMIGEVVTL